MTRGLKLLRRIDSSAFFRALSDVDLFILRPVKGVRYIRFALLSLPRSGRDTLRFIAADLIPGLLSPGLSFLCCTVILLDPNRHFSAGYPAALILLTQLDCGAGP